MSISKKAADAYSLFKKAKKIRTYGKLVKEAINDDTRPGALMKLGIRGMLEIAGKALGTSLNLAPIFYLSQDPSGGTGTGAERFQQSG